MRIFDVNIENISKKHLIHFLHDAMHEARFHRIATVNPEFLLLAKENYRFRENLGRADIRIADGAGVSFAFGLHGETLIERIPGADILHSILTLASAHQYPVFVASKKDGLSSLPEILQAVRKKFPGIEIEGEEFDVTSLLVSYPLGSPILLSNFGAPEQEYFIEKFRDTDSSVRLAMGVGGAFDFLTGKVTRAPQWLRFLGLEWLWRLKEQPKRFPRIFRAVFVFPWRVFTEKA